MFLHFVHLVPRNFFPHSIFLLKFCLKYFSKNHTMVIFEINTLKSKKIPPSVITKYSSRRREYLVMTRGGIFLLWSVFIKIFIEWWTRKTPRRQPRCFSCHHEMNIVSNWTSWQKQREGGIKPRAKGEWFYPSLELFANEFNLVQISHIRCDFCWCILE